jgi:hypothetical protein
MNAWTALLPLLGVVIGATMQYWLSHLAEKQRQREWLKDNKKQEWRELISMLTQSAHHILQNVFGAYAVGVISVITGAEERAIAEANAEARRIIEDRIFIAAEVQHENILERWQLLTAEKSLSRMREYWNDLHDALVAVAFKDCGIRDRVGMNYRKGFYRLYAFLAACWIALCLAITFTRTSIPFVESSLPEEVKQPGFFTLPLEQQRRVLINADKDFAGLPVVEQNKVLEYLSKELQKRRSQRLASALEFSLMPPLVGFALCFLIVPWIASGFSPNK